MKKVTIYTDGACSFNPGVGGWACVLIYKNNKKELSGGQESTTNNQMELKAVIEALKALKQPCEVVINSDSAYVVNAIENNWITSWQLNGWKTSEKKPVKNALMWQELLQLCQNHKVKFKKVKGHSTDQLNNRCDELAKAEIEKISGKQTKDKSDTEKLSKDLKKEKTKKIEKSTEKEKTDSNKSEKDTGKKKKNNSN